LSDIAIDLINRAEFSRRLSVSRFAVRARFVRGGLFLQLELSTAAKIKQTLIAKTGRNFISEILKVLQRLSVCEK